MPSPQVDVATGMTVVFGTSAFSAQILDIRPPGAKRGEIDTSHMGTSVNKTFTPEDFVDRGEMEMDIHFNPDTTPPIAAAAETITITFPAAATWAFTGFVTEYMPDAPLNNKMTATVKVKVSGAITIVAGA